MMAAPWPGARRPGGRQGKRAVSPAAVARSPHERKGTARRVEQPRLPRVRDDDVAERDAATRPAPHLDPVLAWRGNPYALQRRRRDLACVAPLRLEVHAEVGWLFDVEVAHLDTHVV